jgi:hypothetical protein
MQINGIGKLAIDGEERGEFQFSFLTTEGFATGLGELFGDAQALLEAFRAKAAALSCDGWGDPVEIMIVGEPDAGIVDFVTLNESPRDWLE